MSTLDLNELGTAGNYALWSDNPSSLDLLAFSAVAETVPLLSLMTSWTQ